MSSRPRLTERAILAEKHNIFQLVLAEIASSVSPGRNSILFRSAVDILCANLDFQRNQFHTKLTASTYLIQLELFIIREKEHNPLDHIQDGQAEAEHRWPVVPDSRQRRHDSKHSDEGGHRSAKGETADPEDAARQQAQQESCATRAQTRRKLRDD